MLISITKGLIQAIAQSLVSGGGSPPDPGSSYFRPDGVSNILRSDGSSFFLRP